MGDDVICIDSDEDDEDDAPRRGGGRGARGKRSAGGYWRRQRRIGRSRKKWNRQDASHQFIGAPQWLVEALGRLGSGMCFAPGRRNLSPETVCQVAEQLRKLVGRLQDHKRTDGTHTPHTNAEQTEGWRHVLKFLLLLRTAGREDMPTAHAEFSPTRIDSKQRQRLRVRQNRRYQLTVIDILVDYIRFRCESVATGQQQPPASAAALLGECNSIVSSLFVVFEGDTQLVTLTLLRAVLEPRYTLLLYPVFESILTAGCGSPAGPVSGSVTRCTTVPHYVGLLLCFKRWKSLAVTRADRASIERHAVRFLPTRCPTIQLASDVPFLLLLPSVPTKQRAHETRFLLANDLFDVERCIDQYVRHYRQYTAQKAQQSATPHHNTGHRHRLHHSLEIRSNYINVAVLAELIERKVRLWNNRLTGQNPVVAPSGGVDPLSPLRREASSIVESLRLIFRNGTEFSELTLLHVVLECGPSASEALLAAVFEAFLAADPVAVSISTHLDGPDHHHPTGLAVYRSNDVETYVRLVLCYAKWKALCRHRELRGERVRIDGIALSQLPHDCPRAICPRDALLRRILYGDSGTMLASNRSTLTGFLLRTLPDRSDLQDLCFKFLDAYRSGSYATTPSEDTTQQDDVRSALTRAAYKSATTVGDQLPVTECPPHPNDTQAARGQPTHPACGGPSGPEMKPIIIPDSDGLRADGISVPDRALKPMLTRGNQEPFVPQFPSVSMPAVSGCAGDVLTAADIELAPCPPMAECFLNTPPATPQQDAMSEVAGEEDRRNVLVRRHPAGCSGRLRGTIRAIQPRKKRNTIHASTVRRTLGRPLHDGRWWSFADVLAVQSPAERRVPIAVRWWSSMLKIGRPPNRAVSNLTIGSTQLNPRQLAPNDPSGDVLLLQLIDSLGDSVPSDTTAAAKQGAVDFTILADNPHDSMEHQASPSVPIDTSTIFGDGDQTVLLFTEQGPISWPIV